MSKIHDMQSIIGLLENGNFNSEMSAKAREVLTELSDMSSEQHGKSTSGSLTVKLEFNVKEELVEIRSTFEAKTPKRPRKPTHFWVDSQGLLSTEHPRQHDMFSGPREIDALGNRA